MPLKRSTILRWTGAGSLARLAGSVEHLLGAQGIHGKVESVGKSLVIRGPEPITTAATVRRMPGIAWVAAGFAADSPSELTEASGRLARLYLKRGERFSVAAESGGPGRASDAAGAVVSKILDSVKGVKVSESSRVKFRVASDGARGAVGVEVSLGPGGAPTGDEEVSCLVSGGAHSSVVAWFALVAGFRVRLVHARVDQESVLAAARLYSELSNRADPRGLSLEVLEGGSTGGMVGRYLAGQRGRVFAGFHATNGVLPKLRGGVTSPLFLMPEERFRVEFEALGIKGYDAVADWSKKKRSRFGSKAFSGGPASVSDVLDGLA